MGWIPIEPNWGTLRFLSHRASNPSIVTKESIGFDIDSSREAIIPPGKREMMPMDLVLIPPPGCYIRLAPKSGLAWKFRIDVLAGVIYLDIRGEVKVLLQNHGEVPFEVHRGDQIAQGISERALSSLDLISKKVNQMKQTEVTQALEKQIKLLPSKRGK
ncbi:uncharacterized protein [Ambystoma mexicanum]|uniref:uncharacterized protein n=1 Tax=Ambystoma mexicanum TaxID=8296 RepID=UPI0037E79B66